MPINYKVIQEIEVLREFSAGILADIYRCFEVNSDNLQVLADLRNITISIYQNIYFTSSMEQAWIARGKLQIINKIIKQSYSNLDNSVASEEFSEAQFIDIAYKIQDILTTNCTPQNYPKAYILGGQPGAGKSTIISVIMNEILKGNAVIISGDDFRKWHPNYYKLYEMYGDRYVDKTACFSGKMTEYLIEKCSNQKFNLIIEGTLRTTEVPLRTEKLLKAKGYETELAVMAVNPQLSYHNTTTRYEKMLNVGMVARATLKEHHDKVINDIITNIKTIYEANQFDNISLYNRQGICLYSKKSTPQEILKKEYSRAITDDE